MTKDFTLCKERTGNHGLNNYFYITVEESENVDAYFITMDSNLVFDEEKREFYLSYKETLEFIHEKLNDGWTLEI